MLYFAFMPVYVPCVNVHRAGRAMRTLRTRVTDSCDLTCRYWETKQPVCVFYKRSKYSETYCSSRHPNPSPLHPLCAFFLFAGMGLEPRVLYMMGKCSPTAIWQSLLKSGMRAGQWFSGYKHFLFLALTWWLIASESPVPGDSIRK